MTKKKDKETGKESNMDGEGLKLSSGNNAGIRRGTRPGRSPGVTAGKRSADKSKQSEESSGAAKRTNNCAISESDSKKTRLKSSNCAGVWKPRVSAEGLQETATVSANVSSADKQSASTKVTQKETGGRKEKTQAAQASTSKQSDDLTQVPQTPTAKPSKKTKTTKTATSQQAQKEKAQPKSSAKEVPARTQPSGSTSKKSTKSTRSRPSTNPGDSKIQNQNLKDCVTKVPPSRGKRVQEKQAKHKASASKINLDTETNPEYYLQANVRDPEEPDNRIGVCCCLCEKDLGVAPLEGNIQEFPTLPVAAILSCGHTFHDDCLYIGGLEKQQQEPVCVFCDSF